MYRASLCFSVFLTLTCCSDQDAALSQIGGSCSDEAHCAGGLECLDELPGGMCSSTCDESCPDEAVCVDLAGQGYCFAACEETADCRSGYACAYNSYCDLPCGQDEECPEHALCDDTSQACQLRQDQALGEPCLDDSQCDSGLCHLDGETGFCSESCGGDIYCEGGELVCGLVFIGEEARNRCRPPAGDGIIGDLCASGSDCASGACSRGVCVYPCGHADNCLPAATCERRDVDVEGHEVEWEVCLPESGPDIIIDDRGPVPTEVGCVHIEFDAPEDIVAFAVVVWTDEQALLEPRNLNGPDDQRLLDSRGIGPIRIYDEVRTITVLVPNTDDETALPRPGRYELDVCAREVDGPMLLDAELNVRILMKVRPGGVSHDGLMTLNVHLAPNVYGPMTAANAHESPYIEEILERLEHYYTGKCDIEIEEVRFFDMASSYSLIGSDAELDGMFAAVTASAPPASVNIFVVRDLSGVAEWVAGISGGLPGPPYIRGTPHSGVAIATQENGRVAGDTLAHELGHFLGLFHPTEMNGSTQDVISDTPTCTFDPEVWYEIGACSTVDNMMFPTLTPFMEDVTDGQCFVLRGNPGV